MAQHRSPGGQAPSPALDDAHRDGVVRVRGAHRLPPPPSALQGRVVVAAVAAGAFAAAAAGQTLQSTGSSTSSDTDVTPLAHSRDAAAANFSVGGDEAQSVPLQLLGAGRGADAATEAQKLTASEQLTQARLKGNPDPGRAIVDSTARAAEQAADALKQAAPNVAQPKVVRPAEGRYSSGFGGRWGSTHYGVDIANAIGTPILAAMDGTVIEAGPASGFGLWVRIQHDDGTVTVYGHMNSFSVHEGQRVTAGEQIAEIGSRGHSTGPHLHFEVWQDGSKKIDPEPWLRERGVTL